MKTNMSPLELALKYMKIFYSGKDLDNLYQLFSNEFSFKGPYFEFDSAEEYINSLKSDPPVDLEYSIIQSYENTTSACLVYQFLKSGVSIPMAQQFDVSNGKIDKILLIFDAGTFLYNDENLAKE
jgi:hypothetical protein